MLKVLRQTEYSTGDPVVYRVTKRSCTPGPRAAGILTSAHGDEYTYQVDKYWVVDRALPKGRLILRTRRGKLRLVDADDLRLRHPSWWESMKLRARFSHLHPGASNPTELREFSEVNASQMGCLPGPGAPQRDLCDERYPQDFRLE